MQCHRLDNTAGISRNSRIVKCDDMSVAKYRVGPGNILRGVPPSRAPDFPGDFFLSGDRGNTRRGDNYKRERQLRNLHLAVAISTLPDNVW